MHRSTIVAVAGFSIACAVTGCTQDDGVATGSPTVEPDALPENESCAPALPAPIDPTVLIDDLEDRDGFIAPTGGRNGGWSVYSDGTGGTLEPPASSNPAPARIIGGRCGSEYAMRVTGQGFTDWGAGFNIGFRYENDDLGGFDASRYRGVRFWARIGESNTSAIRVQFQDGSTYPAGGVCDPVDLIGPAACYNGHGTGLVPLGTDWQKYEIAFDRLSQRGLFGSPSAFDKSRLYDLEWLIQPNSVFDLWIDDVWFYE
jgi:endoglucanase